MTPLRRPSLPVSFAFVIDVHDSSTNEHLAPAEESTTAVSSVASVASAVSSAVESAVTSAISTSVTEAAASAMTAISSPVAEASSVATSIVSAPAPYPVGNNGTMPAGPTASGSGASKTTSSSHAGQ
jgi:hypothetical protein